MIVYAAATVTTVEQFMNAFHDLAFCRNRESRTLHIMRDGRVLCGCNAWLYAMPMQLLEPNFHRSICGGCLRVERSRSPEPVQRSVKHTQLTMEV